VTFLLVCALLASQAVDAPGGWKQITPIERGRQAMTTDARSAPTRAIRLIFEYEGDRVRLVQQTPVDIVPSTLPTVNAETSGVFVDVRDAENHTLARVAAPEALTTSVEAFPERHDQPITRSDMPRATGAFTVVVPVANAGDHVTIVRTIASPGAPVRGTATVDLVSFPLMPTAPH
jgi:hypothetical protein